MKRTIFFLSLLLLSGCIQSKEHFTIANDGTGTFKANMFIPKATVDMIDNMMGGIAKGMSEAFGATESTSESVAENMFANKEEILKKAAEAGLNIEFINFNSQKKEDGLYVDYEFQFDNINKLLRSEIVATKIALAKNKKGDLVCYLKQNPQKVQESNMQLEQLKASQDSASTEEEKAQLQQFIDVFKDFKAEAAITLPNKIKSAAGLFRKVDDNTASFEVSGNFFEDPQLLDRLFGMIGARSEVVCSTEGLTFNLEEFVDVAKIVEVEKPLDESSDVQIDKNLRGASVVKVILKNGQILEGKFLEKGQNYLKVDCAGVCVTYFNDEIERVEGL